MAELGMNRGDYVLLTGRFHRETVCVVNPDDTLDRKEAIRCNKYTRNNVHVRLGGSLSIKPALGITDATKVQVRPFEDTIEDTVEEVERKLFDKFLKPFFQKSIRPMTKGEVFAVRNGVTVIEFKVMQIVPEPSAFVTSATQIHWKGTPIVRQMEDEYLAGTVYEDVGGLKKAYGELKGHIYLRLHQPRLFMNPSIQLVTGVLLCGPEGSGKRLMTRALANELGASFMMMKGRELLSESCSRLRQAFQTAEQQAPVILYFDNLDAITPEHKCFCELLNQLESKNIADVVVIGATSQPNDIDSQLRSQFAVQVHVLGTTDQSREEILQICSRNLLLASDVNLKQIASETSGYVGSELKVLCSAAACLQIEEALIGIDLNDNKMDAEFLTSLTITKKSFESALNKYHPRHVISEAAVKIPDMTLNDVGGYKDIVEKFLEFVENPIKHQDLHLQFGLRPSKGVLLYGPPGCGKTQLVHAVANQCKMKLLLIKGPELLSQEYGKSESNVRDAFNKAKSEAPCMLLFDEFESIGGKRRTITGASGGTDDRVVNQILTEIDDIKPKDSVFIIGTTNRPETVDAAILRRGRIDKLIYLPVPDEVSRLAIFRQALKDVPVSKEINLEFLATSTNGFTAADVTGVCQNACAAAVKECIKRQEDSQKDKDPKMVEPVSCVEKHHFEEAMSYARRTLSDSEVNEYDRIAATLQKTKSSDFKFPSPDGN